MREKLSSLCPAVAAVARYSLLVGSRSGAYVDYDRVQYFLYYVVSYVRRITQHVFCFVFFFHGCMVCPQPFFPWVAFRQA